MGRKPEGKAEKSFKSFGKKIDGLIKELEQFKKKAKIEYADQIDELKRNKETFKKEFNEFKENDKWDVVEEKIENAGKEIKDAFKAVFTKNKSDKT